MPEKLHFRNLASEIVGDEEFRAFVRKRQSIALALSAIQLLGMAGFLVLQAYFPKIMAHPIISNSINVGLVYVGLLTVSAIAIAVVYVFLGRGTDAAKERILKKYHLDSSDKWGAL